MAVNVSIDGVRELRERAAQMSDEISEQIRISVGQAGEAVREGARQRVPQDTGALHDGIDVVEAEDGFVAEVGPRDPDLYYGVFIEHGTSRRPAIPFMFPAWEDERAGFVARLRRDVGGLK